MDEDTRALVSAVLGHGRELVRAKQYEHALAFFVTVARRLGAGLPAQTEREASDHGGESAPESEIGGTEAEWARAATLVAAGDLEACDVLAQALSMVAASLALTDRPGAAIELYREIVERFGHSSGPWSQWSVASALWNLTLHLEKAGQIVEAREVRDDLILRFAGAADKRIRKQVSSALSRKALALTKASRDAEAMVVHQQLAARGDEALSERVADQTAASLLAIAGYTVRLETVENSLPVIDDLLARFPQPGTAKQITYVATALNQKGVVLHEMGQSAQAVAVFRQLIARFGDSEEAEVRARVADAMQNMAAILEQLGSGSGTNAFFDETLNYLADAEEPELVRKRVQVLAERVIALDAAGKTAEELVAYESTVLEFLAIPPEHRDQETLDRVIWSVLARARVVDDSHPQTAALVDQLALILGDVSEPSVLDRPAAEALREEEIARVLTDLYQRRFWLELATSGTDPVSLLAMQDTASGLYALTQGWLERAGSLESPAFLAAMLVRQIADGYALLTLPWTAQQKAHLNLPLAAAIERAIREAHLDDWAAEHGYLLDMPDSQGFAEELIADNAARTQDNDPDFVSRLMIAIRRYQMLLALCDSPSGRKALQTNQIQSLVTEQLDHARAYAAHIGSQDQDAAPIGVLCVLIAQAYFVASYTPMASSRNVFPEPAFIRDFLTDTNGYRWINNHDIELPGALIE